MTSSWTDATISSRPTGSAAPKLEIGGRCGESCPTIAEVVGRESRDREPGRERPEQERTTGARPEDAVIRGDDGQSVSPFEGGADGRGPPGGDRGDNADGALLQWRHPLVGRTIGPWSPVVDAGRRPRKGG